MKKNREINRKKEIKNKKKKSRKSLLPIILMFIIGLGIMSYPFFSDFYNQMQYKEINRTFDKEAKKIDKSEIERRIRLAEYYNDSIVNPHISDPFTRKNHEKGIKEYARMLQIKESMGYVEIPKIRKSIPIYAGTNEDVLKMGVGHMEFTSLPIGGIGTHCVLTAHSGIPEVVLFDNLHKMKKGDVFFVHNIKEVLAYEVDHIEVIPPTNFEPLKIQEGRDYCTLLTCTPRMINSHRLIVRGERTDYKKASKKVEKNKLIKYIIIILIILLIVTSAYFIRKKIKNRKQKTEIKKETEKI